MGLEVLDSRNIKGEFLRQLTSVSGAGWVGRICSAVLPSDRAAEEYKDLFDIKPLKEAHGERKPTTLLPKEYTLPNVEYETSATFRDSIARRSKLPLLQRVLRQLAIRIQEHWAKLVSTLMVNSETTTAWSPDGQFFVDTDHSEGNSGSLSNDISVDISAQPASVAGTTTAPSLEEAAFVIVRLFEQFLTFKDTEGEPVNEMVEPFILMVPPTLAGVFKHAATNPLLSNGAGNPAAGLAEVHANPRLSDWTTKVLAVIPDQMAFIRQREDGPNMDHLGRGTTFFTMNQKQHFFGVDVTEAAGYGQWQKVCLATMT